MKLLVVGSDIQLKAVAKLIKGFRGVSVESIEGGELTPPSSFVEPPVRTNEGESTVNEESTDNKSDQAGESGNAEGTDKTEQVADNAPVDGSDKKGNKTNKKSNK
jgi:hypothetical protein